MIIVHSYCSYKMSQLGFVYGTFAIDDMTVEGRYFLSDKYNDSVISNSFVNGNVTGVYGRIPGKKERYIFMVKTLYYDYGTEHDNFGRTVSMNLAFEFDDYNEFNRFWCAFGSASSDLHGKELANCLIPDVSVGTYRLTFDKNCLNKWLSSKMSACSINDSGLKDKLMITTVSDSTDYTEELNRLYNFPSVYKNSEVEIGRCDGKEYEYPKKKCCRTIQRSIRRSRVVVKESSSFSKIYMSILRVTMAGVKKVKTLIAALIRGANR